MTKRLTENRLVDWRPVTIMSDTMPPRDPTDYDDEGDDDDEEDWDDEPAVIREPDE
jgi:hypothetical protein